MSGPVDRFARIEAARIARETTLSVKSSKPRRSTGVQREPFEGVKKMRAALCEPRTRARRFGVAKEYDDGRSVVLEQYTTWEQAAARAGQMRDRMTDAECALNFNYKAVQL